MSSAQDDQELREATRALETALDTLRKLRRKGGSPDLEAAERALEAAERHLRAVKRHVARTKTEEEP